MSRQQDGILSPHDAGPDFVGLLPRLDRVETKLSTDGEHLILIFISANGQRANIPFPTGDLLTLTGAVAAAMPELLRRRRQKDT